MALREIRLEGDPILNKECKPVREMTPRIAELIGDMFETMYANSGCGLAAPQVGILKQLCVVDVVNEGNPEDQYVLINPVITVQEGEQTDFEGCLSVPGKSGKVTRAMKIRVSACGRNMEPVEFEAEGFLARAIQHEIDHLHGHLYTEIVKGELYDNEDLQEEDEEE